MSDNKTYRKRNREAMGDNSLDNTTREKLRQTVARIEKLEEEKQGLQDDIKEVYAGAKALGFDTKTIRRLIRERKRTEDERQEEQMMLDLYMEAVDA